MLTTIEQEYMLFVKTIDLYTFNKKTTLMTLSKKLYLIHRCKVLL